MTAFQKRQRPGGCRGEEVAKLKALYGHRHDTANIALTLAARAVADARLHLANYADGTDAPAWEAAEAADLLDAVADTLAHVVVGVEVQS